MKRPLLRKCREDKNLNRPETAPIFGISVIHLRKLEDGDVNPSAPLMFKISRFYNKKPEELFPDVVEKSDQDEDIVHSL